MIDEGLATLDGALAARRPGPYQVQGAIAALHARAPRPEDTDWPQIAALYDRLVETSPSPVVELNRAVAVSRAQGPAAALPLVRALMSEPQLAQYPNPPGITEAIVGPVFGSAAIVLLMIVLVTCSSNDCNDQRQAFGENSAEYQQCQHNAAAGGSRSGCSSWGGYSSGGGHK